MTQRQGRLHDRRDDDGRGLARAERRRGVLRGHRPPGEANLARATHAPNCFLIYESGTLGAKPDILPLSIGDWRPGRARRLGGLGA